MTQTKVVLLALLWVVCASAQAVIEEIKIHADPSARVRPLESIALQVRAYGRAGDATGRVHRDGAALRVLDSDGGWLSKPYRFQGADDERFIDEYQTTAGQIFGQLSSRYALQDAAIYTAPEKPGRYRVQATLAGKTATIEIEVDSRAASNRKAETKTFPPEPVSLDPYRDLAEHWAPLFAQETWWQPKSDYIARFDLDGDWQGDNNWENAETGSSQAYVHYAAMETATHWFLVYNAFHPRDYSDKCVAGSCHENDNEGLILTVTKDGSPFGRLQAMETLAHNNIYSFTADPKVRSGVHDIEGKIEFHDHRPVVFIESGGHGIYGTASSHARYHIGRDTFTEGTGVTYIFKGQAERPKHPNDRLVGYELLPIYSNWWLKTGKDGGWNQRTFDDFYAYEPLGNRPRAAFAYIGGAFLGRQNGQNLAKPFWGWHDNRTRKNDVLATGQWGLDPAYGASRNLSFPQPFSTDYVFNPYLDLGGTAPPEVTDIGAPPVAPSPPPSAVGVPEAASGVFEFRLWVDGSVDVLMRGDRIEYQNLSGSPYRDARHQVSAPLPSSPVQQRVRVRAGRGKVRITESPSAQNGFTTRIRIDDDKRAGDVYDVILEWSR